jgi:hypothetical protein
MEPGLHGFENSSSPDSKDVKLRNSSTALLGR